MKPNALLSLLLLVEFVAPCPCVGDDGSARRYAEPMKDDEPALMLCLLVRPDVQRELKLAAKHITTIKHACCPEWREVPGLMELVAKSRKVESDQTPAAPGREKLAKAANAEFKTRIKAYQRQQLAATLSLNQRQRLDELLTQMVGPMAILENAPIASRLGLSEKQKAEMADTAKHYDAGLGWLRARYGRQQISGFSKGESKQDREKELDALFVVIRATEKERDTALLVGLVPDQLAAWRKIQGKPFPIAWPPGSISDCPCGE
jgi:hypothetical protein